MDQHVEEVTILRDREIRAALLRRLLSLPSPPRALLEELHVHNGNAIADVVAIHAVAHCYEIKGETDSIHRLAKQSAVYDVVFGKTTLVTTAKQLAAAYKVTPEYWGIMVASSSAGLVKLSYQRSAKSSPKFDKRMALLTLWRPELLEIAKALTEKSLNKFTRGQLAEIISNELPSETLQKAISIHLVNRNVK
jgi:hypothetical protein